ncbi:hypothetical protein BDM02DRAFT_3113554 [Thelephora ganbajun]|uniref:Uncharacterized protein n=1 Tax=Thelephora ganbajun TaxID=370292 RepID=A0ACB6ZIZ6_THEGA|nr:hypothetical protein BDM02DRAFT_3113554 [Thelephora ganbajun]
MDEVLRGGFFLTALTSTPLGTHPFSICNKSSTALLAVCFYGLQDFDIKALKERFRGERRFLLASCGQPWRLTKVNLPDIGGGFG